MTKLIWDAAGQRYYEAGVDRGVLYPNVIGTGVPWSGLTAVNETPTGGEATPNYADGVKYFNDTSAEEFAASIEAFTYPEEFALCDGSASNGRGLSFGQQTRMSFGLSYRTMIGNDLDGLDHGYKIHLVYNALASASEHPHGTVTDTPDVPTLNWEITTTPISIPGRRPTAHLTIDSRTTNKDLLSYLEGFLYGSTGISSRLPQPGMLVSLFDQWNSPGLSVPMNFLGIGSTLMRTMVNEAINSSFEASGTTSDVLYNLIPNPSMERSVQQVASVYNEAINGSFEGGTNPTDIRRNKVFNPRLTTNTYYSLGGNATVAVQSPGAIVTHTNGAAAGNAYVAPHVTALTAGKTYSWRIQVEELVGTVNFSAGIHSSPGAILNYGTTVRNGKMLTAFGLFTAAVDNALAMILLDFAGPGLGEQYRIVASTFEESTTSITSFFDGDTPATPDITYKWSGTAGSSESIMQGINPDGVDLAAFDPVYARYYKASNVFSGRGKALALVNRGAHTDQFFNIQYMASWEANTVYTVSVKVRTTKAITNPEQISARLFIEGIGDFRIYSGITGPPGDYEFRFTLNTAGMTGAVRFFRIMNAVNDPGQITYWDDLFVVKGNYKGGYFDGSTPADGEYNYVWTGAANLTKSARLIDKVDGTFQNQAEALRSSKWSARPNGRSIKISPLGVSRDTYASIYGDFSNELQLKSNTRYTVMATIHLDKAQTSFDAALARRIIVHSRDADLNPYIRTDSEQAPNAPGTYQLRMEFVTAPNVREAFVRLYNGSDDYNSPVYWDDILLMEGSYKGDYFDGDFGQVGDFGHRWQGVAQYSPSAKTVKDITGVYSPYQTGLGFLSTEWSSSGTKSLRVGRKQSAPFTFDTMVVHGPNVFLKKDVTYTMAAKIRIPRRHESDYGAARALQVHDYTGFIVTSAQAPKEPGVYQLSLTFKAPRDDMFYVRFSNGGLETDPDVWFDDYVLVEGEDAVPYFDGGSAPFVYQNQVVTPMYTGATDASKSSFQYNSGFPTPAKKGDAVLLDNNLIRVNEVGIWENIGPVSGALVA